HLNQMISASTQAHRQETLQQLQDIRDHKKPQRHDQTAHKSTASDEPSADYWFMNQPSASAAASIPKDFATFTSQTVQPGSQDNDTTTSGPLTSDEQKLLTKVHHEQEETPVAYGHTPVIEPIGKQKSHSKQHHSGGKPAKHGKQRPAKPAMTQTPDPAILSLANNDD